MVLIDSDDETDESESAVNDVCTIIKKEPCRNCLRCCYTILYKHNMYSKAYVMLYKAYKILLTLSITQVACERAFSKLKQVINKTFLNNKMNIN